MTPASPPTNRQPIDEDDEVAALRKLLSSGPRTNRQRPAALQEEPESSSMGRAATSAQRLLQLLQDRSGLDEAEPMLQTELSQREQRYGKDHPDLLVPKQASQG